MFPPSVGIFGLGFLAPFFCMAGPTGMRAGGGFLTFDFFLFGGLRGIKPYLLFFFLPG